MNIKNLIYPVFCVFLITIFSCTEEPAIGEYSPVAIIEITPSIGDTTTIFIANASQSYDEYNPNAKLEFQFNWGENEIWTDYSFNSNSSYQYNSIGSYIVTVRVIDSSGWTDTDFAEIMVIENNE